MSRCPGWTGLTMLRHLMAQMPLPVVMLSSLTSEQAPTAIEALSIGAVDVVGKPGGTISLNIGDIADEIVPKVRAAATARVSPGRAPRTPGSGERTLRSGGGGPKNRPVSPRGTATIDHVETSPSRPDPSGARPVEPDAWAASGQEESPLVVVGSSTGGPKALTQLLTGCRRAFPRRSSSCSTCPWDLHRRSPPASTMCRRFVSPRRRRDGCQGPGEVWVARGGVHLTFSPSKMMREDMSPPHLGVRPAVDITLESAVEQWGGRLIVVILTGMGMDGARGCRKVKQAGGIVLAQDEQSSVIYGMPRAVIEMGLPTGSRASRTWRKRCSRQSKHHQALKQWNTGAAGGTKDAFEHWNKDANEHWNEDDDGVRIDHRRDCGRHLGRF